MKSVRKYYIAPILLGFFAVIAGGQTTHTSAQKASIKEFEERAKQYVKLREKVESRLPKMPKKATKEQIQAHHDALLRGVKQARAGAKQGDIFTPDTSLIIRQMLRDEFKGRDRRELRERVFEAEDKNIKVRANIEYPESKEIMDMPPQLLLTLPQLPKQLKYRLVGTYLVLVDRENELIVDYMTNALP